jgi:hypothetical protein
MSFTFKTTGRWFYENGYIGIGTKKNGEIIIAQGYDGGIDIEPDEEMDDFAGPKMTKEEREELADYMISLWQRFKTEGYVEA